MNEQNLLQFMLETTIRVLLPLVLVAAFGAIMKLSAKLKVSVKKENRELAYVIIKQLVMAAEQSGLSGALAKEGIEKKKFVLDRAEQVLANSGIKLDLDEMDNMIETAVFDVFGKIKLEDVLLGDAPKDEPQVPAQV